MASVHKNRPGIVAVELTAKEARDAIEHAAWCAAVNDDASIAITDSALVIRHRNGGYRVRYKRLDRKSRD